MENSIGDVLIPIISVIVTFGCTLGVFYLFFMTRNKERLALIEKGVGADIFKSRITNKTPGGRNYFMLKIGMFLVGVAVGVLMANLLVEYLRMYEGVAYTSMIMLFGGLSLIIYYIIEKKLVITEQK
jgi:uncharacterized protein YybS (DUF2232 family)